MLSAINNNLVLILLAPNNKAIPSVDVVEGTKYSWPDNKILGSNCVVPLIIVLFDKVVIPETFNELFIEVVLFNIVAPDTYNELYTVTLFCSVELYAFFACPVIYEF